MQVIRVPERRANNPIMYAILRPYATPQLHITFKYEREQGFLKKMSLLSRYGDISVIFRNICLKGNLLEYVYVYAL